MFAERFAAKPSPRRFVDQDALAGNAGDFRPCSSTSRLIGPWYKTAQFATVAVPRGLQPTSCISRSSMPLTEKQ